MLSCFNNKFKIGDETMVCEVWKQQKEKGCGHNNTIH